MTMQLRSRIPLFLILAATAGACTVSVEDGPYLETYEPCGSTSQCLSTTDSCYTITVDYGSDIVSDGMCSRSCGNDGDCPFGGACYTVQSGPPICYARCAFDEDCPPGYACLDTVGGWRGDAICLPY
jgi:hypothetical protein